MLIVRSQKWRVVGAVTMTLWIHQAIAYTGVPKPKIRVPAVEEEIAATPLVKTLKRWPQPVVESKGDFEAESFLEELIGGPLYEHQANLPRLPVPSLEETMERFLPTALPLAKTNDEANSLKQACSDFLQEAQKLQERLLQRKEKKKNTSWLQHWWNALGYLKVRDPVVIFVSYFFELPDDPTLLGTSELGIQRAAEALHAATEYRNLVCSGSLPQETIGKQATPLCSAAYKYMFHACRIPRHSQDGYRIYDPVQHPHAVVACKGQFYTMELTDQSTGEPLALHVLEDQLRQVKERAEKSQSSFELGWLTTSNRDDWAHARDELLRAGGFEMKEALTMLESGALMVCLDDEEPVSHRQCARQYLHGFGGNRWYDKSIQLVCTNNGKLGFIGEHSMMDGMPTAGFCQHILKTTYRDCLEEECDIGLLEDDNKGKVTNIFEDVFEQMSDIDKDHIQSLIDNAKSDFTMLVADQELEVQSFQGYGSDFIKSAGFSPDAYVQMAIQLATYRLFGEQVATYEATQVRPFLHGRTETTRAVSLESQAFVREMGPRPKMDESDPTIKQEKLDLLRKAAEGHRNYIQNAAQGMGVDRHLFGLSQLIRYGENPPALFSHPLYQKSKTWRVSTSTLHPALGFGEVVPDGVGVGYEIKPESISFFVTGRKEYDFADRLAHLLEEALIELHRVAEPLNDELIN